MSEDGFVSVRLSRIGSPPVQSADTQHSSKVRHLNIRGGSSRLTGFVPYRTHSAKRCGSDLISRPSLVLLGTGMPKRPFPLHHTQRNEQTLLSSPRYSLHTYRMYPYGVLDWTCIRYTLLSSCVPRCCNVASAHSLSVADICTLYCDKAQFRVDSEIVVELNWRTMTLQDYPDTEGLPAATPTCQVAECG